jgi:hypothetical protein
MAPFTSRRERLSTPGPTRKLFTRDSHNFRLYRTPTITVTAPDCGPSGQIGNLNALSAEGSPAPFFPTLTWSFTSDAGDEKAEHQLVAENEAKTKEYLLLAEDIDDNRWTWFADLPTPALLGVYYGIPAVTTSIRAEDLVKMKKGIKWIQTAQRSLVGGFKFGDVGGKVWKAPKPWHRIHFQIVALSKSVDENELSEHPTRESFNGAVEGRVLGWGEWVGVYQKE